MKFFVKYMAVFLAFFLPFHALMVTGIKCKLGLNTNLMRFWKEAIIALLLGIGFIAILKSKKYKLSKIWENNYIIGFSLAFIVSTIIYIFFPLFQVGLHSFLGFKYDVFFIFALLAGISLVPIQNSVNTLILTVSASAGLVLLIFLPWYIFGDISAITYLFGYSSEVSTYSADSCISFSQNVAGHHRFQGSFGGPIRFSVFLTVFLFIYLGYIFDHIKSKKILVLAASPAVIGVVLSVFFSYSKTSMLGLIVGTGIFLWFIYKLKLGRTISKKMKHLFYGIGGIVGVGLLGIMYIKRDLFLHLGSILNRFDNLTLAVKKFWYNPLGYGVGTAGPATQIGELESSVSWKASMNNVAVYKYLPENWYVQLLIEQSFVGLGFFIGLLFALGLGLYKIARYKKDFISIGLLSGFLALLFMANFTHAFEESATSYILFLILGGYIGKNFNIIIKK